MNEVHVLAAHGSGAEAVADDRSWPSLPPDVVTWLIERLGIKPGRQVVDLAAGTGALTALLADVGADIVAIEPVTSMRDQLRARLPGIPVLAGVAEALPLGEASVDAVVVARAFHWFDTRRAMAEITRVVRPGGCLALIWHTRDRSVEWVDQVWSLMERDGGNRWSRWTEATFNFVNDGLPAKVDAMYSERLG